MVNKRTDARICNLWDAATTESGQFDSLLSPVFHASVLLLTMNFFVMALFNSSVRIHAAIHSYSDSAMTKFMINNRTDAGKTDVNLLNGGWYPPQRRHPQSVGGLSFFFFQTKRIKT